MSAAGEGLTEPLHNFALPGKMQLDSRILLQHKRPPVGRSFIFRNGARSRTYLHAVRMSAAGEGLTEPLHNFVLPDKMQLDSRIHPPDTHPLGLPFVLA